MQQFARVHTDKGLVPVILKGQQPLDLRPIVSDITADALAGGALADVDTSLLSPVAGAFTYLAPVEGIRQIAATGFNDRKHIEEFHMRPPTEPEVFLKGIGSLAGPFDPISRGPNKGVKLDWETELTVVIGREGRTSRPPRRLPISSATSVSTTSRTGRPRSMRKASNIWCAPSRGRPIARSARTSQPASTA
jgi:2,4-diketo-3-deoxy-L-fuconate hydrolase